MTLLRKTLPAAIALVVACGLMSACSSGDSPSAPSSPSNPSAPRIVSMSPGTPTASGTAQTITVSGERFASGLTVLLDASNGVWTTYSGSAITVQSATTFTATVMLDRVGVWDITLHSASGLESNEMQFSVAAAAVTPEPDGSAAGSGGMRLRGQYADSTPAVTDQRPGSAASASRDSSSTR